LGLDKRPCEFDSHPFRLGSGSWKKNERD